MLAFLAEYGLFLAKTLTITIGILLLVLGLVAIIGKAKGMEKGKLRIKSLNDKFTEMRHSLQQVLLSKSELKAIDKAEKQTKKQAKNSQAEEDSSARKRIFVLQFKGDIKAEAVAALREEITAILTIARPEQDEVLLSLESAGGLVHAYGLGASQLQRITERNIALTVCVDKVAASGGYLMACVADKILAAPFAVIGSIGVIAQLPNFHRFLNKHNIDIEQLSAGEFKRTITLLGKNTDKDRAKFQEQLEDTHMLFKDYVKQQRASLDIDQVATGEHWYGERALKLGLVDHLQTSDDYLLAASEQAHLYTVKYQAKKPLSSKLSSMVQQVLERAKLSLRHPTEDKLV
jgi:serine protease SohB